MPDAVRVTYPFIDINAFRGLATKQNPETLDPVYLAEAKNVDFFRVYGAISKIRGNKRILNTAYTEGGVAKRIGWTGFYKFPDPNGQILRHTLAACGTTLRKINSDGTTTELKTGLTEGLIRTSDKMDRFMFITGQDMFTVGNKDAMMMYDGQTVHDWGLKSPGEIETVIDDFGTSRTFDYQNSSAGVLTITDESTITWDGDSKKIFCSSAGTFNFNEIYPTFSIPTTTVNRVKFYMYIPRDQYASLGTGSTTNSAFQITFGSTSPGVGNPIAADYYRFYFPRDMLQEGWNELFCDFSTEPTGSVGISSSAPAAPTFVPSSVDVIQYQFITSGLLTVYMDHLVVLEAGAPSVAVVDPASRAVFSWAGNTEDPFAIRTVVDGFTTLANYNVPVGAGPVLNTFSIKTDGSPNGTNNCVELNKLSTGESYVSLDRDNTDLVAFDMTSGKDGKFFIWVYIPDTFQLRRYASTPGNFAVRLFLTSAPKAVGPRGAPGFNGTTLTGAQWVGATSYWDKNFGDSESLVNGWNQLVFDSAAASGVVGGAATLTSVVNFVVAFRFASTNVVMSGIKVDTLGVYTNFIDYDSSTYIDDDATPPTLPPVPASFTVDGVTYSGWDDAGLSVNTLELSKVVGTRSNSINILVDASNGPGDFTVLGTANSPAKTLLYFYLPDPTLLLNTFPIEMTLYSVYSTTSPSTNVFSKWIIPYTSLNSGWNTIEIDLTQPDDEGNGGITDWDSTPITNVNMKFLFKGENTLCRGIHLLGLVSFDEDGALSGGGVYSYRITYETEEGFESNAGPQSPSVQIATGGQNVQLTSIPISNDQAVTKKNIYRTAGSGGLWLYLDTIPNSQTTYDDTIADGSLGATQPPFAGDDTFDNSTPPSCGIVKVWKRTVFLAGDPLAPQVLYFSRPDNPSSFPVLNAYELDSRITGLYESYLGLVVTTETDTWRVIGDNPQYTVEKVIPGIGAVGPRAVGAIRLDGWAVNRDGLRLFDLRNMVPISEQVRDKYFTLPKRHIELLHSVHFRKMNAYLQFNPDNDGNYTSVFMYQYESDDARTGVGWSELVLPEGLNILHTTETEDSDGEWHLYAGATDGMIYELFAEDSLNWVDAAGVQTPITCSFGTHYMRLGSLGQETQLGTGRVISRFVEIRAEEQQGNESNWGVEVETAYGPNDGAFSFGIDSKIYTLPAGVSFYRLASDPTAFTAASHIRIRVENSESDVDLIFYGLRIHLVVYPDQRPVETGNVY